MPLAANHAALPTHTRCPSTLPSIPCPGDSRTRSGRASASASLAAWRTIAAASTCVESWSTDAAKRNSRSRGSPFTLTTRSTAGTPSVSVPVLSSSTVCASPNRSMATPPFTITPALAARESPATNAIGAARISGQGVATTSTASARTASPEISHAAPAMESVSGRKKTA